MSIVDASGVFAQRAQKVRQDRDAAAIMDFTPINLNAKEVRALAERASEAQKLSIGLWHGATHIQGDDHISFMYRSAPNSPFSDLDIHIEKLSPYEYNISMLNEHKAGGRNSSAQTVVLGYTDFDEVLAIIDTFMEDAQKRPRLVANGPVPPRKG